MIHIEPVTICSPPQSLEQVRALFRSYGDFLRDIGGDVLRCFSRLDEEIPLLPAAYADQRGELLLATEASQAAGCIAYRSLEGSTHPSPCELKRLFVSPSFPGRGLGKRLITVALERARQKGYRTACLDTEPHSMAAAKQIYLDLGFVLDHQRSAQSEDNPIIFFHKSLSASSAT